MQWSVYLQAASQRKSSATAEFRDGDNLKMGVFKYPSHKIQHEKDMGRGRQRLLHRTRPHVIVVGVLHSAQGFHHGITHGFTAY